MVSEEYFVPNSNVRLLHMGGGITSDLILQKSLSAI